MRTKEELIILWKEFENIPIGERDDNIDKPFLHFEKGTDRFEIWHWFEEQGISIDKLGIK